jgi:ATP-binding cassette subfamily F protein 3
MLVKPANLMLLDEPTNHLDISSQEVLQEAMAQYEGTIMIVSHNRYFVNSFVNKVLEIRNGRATVYEGNVEDYLDRRGKERDAEAGKPDKPSVAGQNEGQNISGQSSDKKTLRREKAKFRQQLHHQLRPFKETVKEAEKLIEELETRKQELESLLADPELYKDHDSWAEISREYQTVERRLERNYTKWEDAQAKIEELEESEAELS